MGVRGIRGATVVEQDTPAHVLAATRELLDALVRANGLAPGDVISAIFTTTPDIRSEFPARAARELGWQDVALLGATEMAVPTGIPRCIRVLLHVETDRSAARVTHVYLHAAAALRPDRSPDAAHKEQSG